MTLQQAIQNLDNLVNLLGRLTEGTELYIETKAKHAEAKDAVNALILEQAIAKRENGEELTAVEKMYIEAAELEVIETAQVVIKKANRKVGEVSRKHGNYHPATIAAKDKAFGIKSALERFVLMRNMLKAGYECFDLMVGSFGKLRDAISIDKLSYI